MRDVTNIPDALLAVIARAIRLHVQSYCGSIMKRLDALESRELPAPVVIENSAPAAKDFTSDIEALRRSNDELARQRAEDVRELDRAHLTIDAMRKEIDALAAREVPVPKDGKDGEPGRDAFELDVLPAIDFERSYPRGTLAQHQGGLWRAHANTQKWHGWSVIVEGVHEINIERIDERTFSLVATLTGGKSAEQRFTMPVLIYRGVYQPSQTYAAGDTVTWAGSLWHANEETSAKPDQGGGAWTLAAKRGRDGKDLQGVAA
jgi:hypothetical protein